MLKIQTILAPIDFSDTAAQALGVAKSLARDHHAKLVLMTAPPWQPTPPVTEAYVPELDDPRQLEESRRLLEQAANAITDLPVDTRLVMGGPGPAIIAAAKDCQADLIVMGTHGRTGLFRVLLGSVAEYVLRHAPCPVLTIKPQTAEHLRQEVETGLSASPSA
jgi:universal stress protein A